MNKKKPNYYLELPEENEPTFADWLSPCDDIVTLHSDWRKIGDAWHENSIGYISDIRNMLPSLKTIGVSMVSKGYRQTIYPCILADTLKKTDGNIFMRFYQQRDFLERLKKLVDFLLSLQNDDASEKAFNEAHTLLMNEIL